MQLFLGVYDTFSAMVVAKRHRHLFLSGLSYSASHGLPDIGFLTWEHVLTQSAEIMRACPDCRLLVDLDDGFGGPEIVSHVVSELERLGVYGVVLEDQKRPKRCGHLSGKQVVPLTSYLEVLEQVLAVRQNLFVVARTDATDEAEIAKRVQAFGQLDVDAILVDGISMARYQQYKAMVKNKPFVYNYIVGGRSEAIKDDCDIVFMSTACLSVAAQAIEQMVETVEAGKHDEIGGYSLPMIISLTEQHFHKKTV
ncbi:MAG: isocitrate lyase/PEP mutase family protein [Pseudomonadota bacterium]